MNISEIAMKLIGPVQPVGEHNEDTRRLENLKVMTEVIDRLLSEVDRAARNKDRVEYSMKAIGKHAAEFLANVKATP